MRQRVKAGLVMTLLWGASFATVAAAVTGYGFATSIMPPIPRTLLALKVLAFLATAGAIGCAAGVLFSSIVARVERARAFSTLSSRRFGAWGFASASSVFLAVNAANTILTGAPFDRSNLSWAVVYGIVGATIGAATFAVAKRARQADGTSMNRDAFVAR